MVQVTYLIEDKFYEGVENPMRKINANIMTADVHASMNDSQLMEKYNPSAKQLRNMLEKLQEADLIIHMQFCERTGLSDSQLVWALGDRGQATRELD
jgi:hypothetical protein